jgi:D-alanyl-D-alanine carboxypeptidase
VVMGQPSARERDLKAADLFDYGFSQSTGWTNQSLDALPASGIAAAPDMRPYICDKRKPMPVDEGQGAIIASAGAAGASADNANAQLMAAAAPPSSALAFATLNSANLRTRALPPRAPLQPILVWIGRDPAEGQIMLNEQEEAQKAERDAARTAKLEAAKAKREAAKQARAEKAAAQPKPAAGHPDAKPKAVARGASVPKAASAYTSVESKPGIPQAKGGVAAHAAKPVAAKSAAAKSTAANPAAPKAGAAKVAPKPAAKKPAIQAKAKE